MIDFFTTAANHVLSYGDDFLKAPDAVEIVPKADPLSEALKYSLFAVNLSSVDVNIREKDSLLQLKVLWAWSGSGCGSGVGVVLCYVGVV